VRVRFLHVLLGAALFLAYQYGVSLWKLTHSSQAMENKFSALARDEFMGFLVLQNLKMLMAYALLALIATFLVQPLVTFWTKRSKHKGVISVILRSAALTTLIHGYCTLRLVETRPYFLDEAEFGHWYYKALDLIPLAIKPASLFGLFVVLPLLFIGLASLWQINRRGRKGWLAAAAVAVIVGSIFAITREAPNPPQITKADAGSPLNIILIASDSLRGDRVGYAGYRPRRSDGLAKDGVSPTIDALAARSVQFENCYTAIASTMESVVQLMASKYPHSHGIRQMYPDRATVEKTEQKIIPFARLLRQKGYDTAVIGDWCAGFYEVLPLDFEHISVSNFDTFKIYMSQAVIMAHFVIPLYFDNPLGYHLFPQIMSFAQFVTPEVVTQRVEKRIATAAETKTPFFWHVFYSCNHLPYRSAEPFLSAFTDPDYQGPNKNGVNFDIDNFIGGTSLESKWQALPPKEIQQIRDLYDGCTRQFDECVKRILASLEANGLAENTIVIITSDHGDDLYEPGVTLGHGLTFNGGLQANHVPLVFHVPGALPAKIPELVRMVDIVPTLADLVGVEKPEAWQGQSLAGWIWQTEKPKHLPFYGETGFPFIQFTVPGVERPKLPPMDEMTYIEKDFNYQFVLKEKYVEPLIRAKQRCLKTQFWKLVCTPTAAGGRHFGLFQMNQDPHGEVDLAAQRPEVLSVMQTALERWMDQQIESSIEEIFPNGEPQ